MFGRLHTSAPWRCFCVVLSCRQRLRVQGSCISLLNFSASSINNNQKPRSLLYTWLFIVSNSLCIKPFHCIHQMQQLSSEENYTHVPKKKKKKKKKEDNKKFNTRRGNRTLQIHKLQQISTYKHCYDRYIN